MFLYGFIAKPDFSDTENSKNGQTWRYEETEPPARMSDQQFAICILYLSVCVIFDIMLILAGCLMCMGRKRVSQIIK